MINWFFVVYDDWPMDGGYELAVFWDLETAQKFCEGLADAFDPFIDMVS